MEINVSNDVINTVCNSLRDSRRSLKLQLEGKIKKGKKEIIEHQIAEVEKALRVFEYFEY